LPQSIAHCTRGKQNHPPTPQRRNFYQLGNRERDTATKRIAFAEAKPVKPPYLEERGEINRSQKVLRILELRISKAEKGIFLFSWNC